MPRHTPNPGLRLSNRHANRTSATRRQRKRYAQHRDTSRSYAYPFDKHKYTHNNDLPTIQDVRDHLIDKHTIPIHCPICYNTFASRQEWDRHIVLSRDHPVGFSTAWAKTKSGSYVSCGTRAKSPLSENGPGRPEPQNVVLGQMKLGSIYGPFAFRACNVRVGSA